MLQDALFQAQGIGVILVVVVQHGEASVATAFVQGDGRRVVAAHLKPQVGAVMLPRAGFDPLQQALAQARPAGLDRDGDRVQAGQGGPAMEQHQGITQQLSRLLGDDQARMGAADHPLEAAHRQAIGGETLLFQSH